MKIIYAEPCYTGGGINTYIGELDNGTYFIADDGNYYVRIVDQATYHGKEECWYIEWQEQHLIEDLQGDQVVEFFENMLEWIKEHKPDDYKYLDLSCTYANLKVWDYNNWI